MVRNILKSVVISYIVSFSLLLIFAMIMFYMNVSDKTVSIFVIIIYFLSALFGGLYIAKSVDKRKFLWGIILGGIYFGMIFVLSIIGNRSGNVINSSALIGLITSMFGGMIGGMIG